jgi:transposase
MLAKPRSTEKTSAVLEPSEAPPQELPLAPQGHGRNGARSYTGAKEGCGSASSLHAGDPCPGCGKGKAYPQKEPKTLVRMVGQAPLAAPVYELDRLRCNLCGGVFTAEEPEGIGPEKYDETTAR